MGKPRHRYESKKLPERLRKLQWLVDNAFPLFIVADLRVPLTKVSKSNFTRSYFDLLSRGNLCAKGVLRNLQR